MTRWVLPFLLVLAGCAKEPAGYQIAGGNLSITVERVQSYFWSSGWELNLIVQRNPECQRRHALKPTTGDRVKVELYSPEPGVFILKQGKRWYVTELRTCGFDAYKEPPPEPGELVGTFQEKDGIFKFVASTDRTGKANPSVAEND